MQVQNLHKCNYFINGSCNHSFKVVDFEIKICSSINQSICYTKINTQKNLLKGYVNKSFANEPLIINPSLNLTKLITRILSKCFMFKQEKIKYLFN